MRQASKHVTLCKTAVLDAIEQKGFSPKDVADMLGMGRDYVTNLFTPSRKGEIAYTSAIAIAHILGKDLDELIIKEPEPEKPSMATSTDLSVIVDEISGIKSEMSGLTLALKQLGNIEMQMLEYVRAIKKSLE